FGTDLETFMSHYTEDSIFFSPEGEIRGLEPMRANFTAIFKNLPPGFVERMQFLREDFDGDIGFVTWKTEPFVPLGTDTFVVRNGKILVHTFAAYLAQKPPEKR